MQDLKPCNSEEWRMNGFRESSETRQYTWQRNLFTETGRGHCIKLWKARLGGSSDPEILEMAERETRTQGSCTQGVEPAPKRDECYQQQRHLRDIWDGVLALWDLCLCLVSVLLWSHITSLVSLVLPSRVGELCAIVGWKYVICFLIFTGFTIKRLPWALKDGRLKGGETTKNYGDF